MVSIDASKLSPEQLREILTRRSVDVDDESEWPKLRLENVDPSLPLLPFHDAGVTLRIESRVPDDSFFYMVRGEIDLRGQVGHSLAAGMSGGVVRVRGNVGDACGACMSGGTLAIYQSAGQRVGAAMTGGGLFVRGDVGQQCGYAAVGGSIVIGGDAGEQLGARSRGVTFFVRGEIKSLGDGLVSAPLRKQAQLQLSMLLLNSSIAGPSNDFKRFVHRDQLAAEKDVQGEVTSSWR